MRDGLFGEMCRNSERKLSVNRLGFEQKEFFS